MSDCKASNIFEYNYYIFQISKNDAIWLFKFINKIIKINFPNEFVYIVDVWSGHKDSKFYT